MCLDVVILGAGLAGSLTAWKFRHHNYNMTLYEMPDENEAKLKTETIQMRNLTYHLEIGVPWFQSVSQELNEILAYLDLSQTLRKYPHVDTKYHLRGKDVSFLDNTEGIYSIDDLTTYYDPVETLREVLQQWLKNTETDANVLQFTVEGTTMGNISDMRVNVDQTMLNDSNEVPIYEITRYIAILITGWERF